jgi:hypothetical protein
MGVVVLSITFSNGRLCVLAFEWYDEAVKRGSPNIILQRATPIIVSYFAKRTWKNNNEWRI